MTFVQAYFELHNGKRELFDKNIIIQKDETSQVLVCMIAMNLSFINDRLAELTQLLTETQIVLNNDMPN